MSRSQPIDCPSCNLPFECEAPSPDCWCSGAAVWDRVHEATQETYGSACLCKTCLSLLSFCNSNVLRSVWGLPTS
jgi:hypothetical protein